MITNFTVPQSIKSKLGKSHIWGTAKIPSEVGNFDWNYEKAQGEGENSAFVDCWSMWKFCFGL